MTYYDNPLDELKGKTVDAYEMAVKIYDISKKSKNEDTINGLGYATALLFEMTIKALEQEPKTGHWIEDENEMEVWCSECGEENDDCSKYCPNCGAKMVEPQESEGNE